jgi:hypothetical protein
MSQTTKKERQHHDEDPQLSTTKQTQRTTTTTKQNRRQARHDHQPLRRPTEDHRQTTSNSRIQIPYRRKHLTKTKIQTTRQNT